MVPPSTVELIVICLAFQFNEMVGAAFFVSSKVVVAEAISQLLKAFALIVLIPISGRKSPSYRVEVFFGSVPSVVYRIVTSGQSRAIEIFSVDEFCEITGLGISR